MLVYFTTFPSFRRKYEISGSLFTLPVMCKARAQDPSYHTFADSRTMLGIPNFLNVITPPFAVVAFLGLSITRNMTEKRLRTICFTIFIGFLLLDVGSGYYHLHHNINSLVGCVHKCMM